MLNAGDRLVEVPDGWVSDSYSISGVKWLVIYSPEKGIKKLYIKDVFVCETETDIFYFQQDEGSVKVVRHLRRGFYELEIIRSGVSLLSGKPKSSSIKEVKGKVMVAGYMMFAIWMYVSFRGAVGF
ncbi:MAG: hypothetical protein ABJQ78_10545 [Alloalcanivorax sp.]